MMWRFYYLFFLFSIGTYSCGLIQGTKTTDKSSNLINLSSSRKAAAEKLQNEKTVRLTHQVDLARNAFTIQIWPKGKISFSADSGFIGEADHILITGEVRELVNRAERLVVNKQSKNKLMVNQTQNRKMETTQKLEVRKSTTTYKWIIVVLVLVGCARFYLVRK